ncbi:MAG TPA: lysylphosphatidylglycerol synthase transmembrane domain-containing protein [Chloroflexota bacterium]|nr:lysylphosphatidylglycerol synthase transmembrane domain-containing protein [Chloroflexota bacterium]
MRVLSRLVGLALTVVFLALALSKVDLAGFADELRTVDYRWLIPSTVCTLLGYVVRTMRWRIILSGAARAPVSTLFPVLIMGFATNNLLPGRLGEFWRAYLLGRKRGVRKTLALASVFVERVFDGLTLIALLGIVSMSMQLPGWSRQIELVAAFIFLGASSAVFFLLWFPATALALMGRLTVPLPPRWSAWGEARAAAFIDGLAPLRKPTVLLGAAALSVGVWLLEGGSYLLLSRGMNLGLPASLELPGIGLALVTINLGIMVPSGPGYVGTQEFFGTAALQVVGANPQAALALVVVSHAVQYVLVTGLGLAFFAREHLFPRDLRPTLAEEAAA